ncbi:hypothetical protein AWV79_27735 [Cupriavidus sp. UYMMa02A]|nr:hypothetical protein AWV79_27735 [Cupriavidus sp. UYMMa02A]
MSKSFHIYSPQVASDGDRVLFTFEANGEKGNGFVSRSALDELAQGQVGHLVDVFHRHLDRIQEQARLQWAVNPMNKVIVLGSGDF